MNEVKGAAKMQLRFPRLLQALSSSAIIVTVLTLALSGGTPASAASLPGPLPGSTFEGGDGNLTVDTPGNTDWANVKNVAIKQDKQSGPTDDAFGQGAKEDLPAPTIVTGSIPNNKNDLTRFYEASEYASKSNYLYLAWERAVNIGSADIDFEINRLQCSTKTPSGCSANGVTPIRSANDLLVLFEFSGSGTPTIQISTWIPSGLNAKADCEAGGPYPCWGTVKTLDSTQAEAAVNTAPVPDPLNGGAMLDVGLFGETAINLTAAGVFPSTSCQHYGSAFTKARSSGSSFDSELKDFIAPTNINISNCGSVIIHKVTQPAGGTGFGFTTTGGAPLSNFSLDDGGTQSYLGNVPPGSYSVSENAKSGWALVSLQCAASGDPGTTVTPNGTSTSNPLASMTVTPNGTVECTYTNHILATPTIATTLSANPVNTNTPVNDSAKLSNATFDAGGNVQYWVFNSAQDCQNATTTAAVNAGLVTVTNGAVPNSNPVKFSTAGTYYWQAVYTGDTYNTGAKSDCSSEVLVVKTNPSLSTLLQPGSSVNVGASVNDTATLSGATATATGTVTYTVYNDSACASVFMSAGTVNLVNGQPGPSNSITFNTAGTYYWQAVYNGDGANNGATSVCTSETLVVNPLQSAISTAQNLLPNDSATISGVTANAGGTVTFELFPPNNAMCDTSIGAPTYTSGAVSVNGPGTYKTNNTSVYVSTVGTWRWLVIYSGDHNNVGSTSACGVENFTITNG